MPSKVFSATVVGLDAQIVEVETDVNYGLRSFVNYGQYHNNYLEFKLKVKV